MSALSVRCLATLVSVASIMMSNTCGTFLLFLVCIIVTCHDPSDIVEHLQM